MNQKLSNDNEDVERKRKYYHNSIFQKGLGILHQEK
jgi:hypothetical protein